MAKFAVAVVVAASIVNTGSPWDWQSGNAKYPVFDLAAKGQKYLETIRLRSPTIVMANSNATALTGNAGSSIELPCVVKHLGEFTVSWLRGRDMSVLSVGELTFSSDRRYQVVHVAKPDAEDSTRDVEEWNLKINDLTMRDTGWYECQVNTEPKISGRSFLNVSNDKAAAKRMQDSPVKQQISRDGDHGAAAADDDVARQNSQEVVPEAVIMGPEELRLRTGDTLALECTISHLVRPPSAIFWQHDGVTVTPKRRSGVSIESQKWAGTSFTKVVLVELRREDAGSYACMTDVSPPAMVRVFVVPDSSSSRKAQALPSRVSSSAKPSPPKLSATIIFIILFAF